MLNVAMRLNSLSIFISVVYSGKVAMAVPIQRGRFYQISGVLTRIALRRGRGGFRVEFHTFISDTF
jgi:hypothetical protein